MYLLYSDEDAFPLKSWQLQGEKHGNMRDLEKNLRPDLRVYVFFSRLPTSVQNKRVFH